MKKNASTKLPALQFYTGDWRKDPGVQSLDFYERGVWFEILCIMHESEHRGKLMLNGRRMPDEALARLLGLDNQKCNQIVSKLIEYGVARVEDTTGIIFNKRMVRDEELRQIRKKCGEKGGNPSLVNQNRNQNPTTQVNQNPTPSFSVSISSSDKERDSPTDKVKKGTRFAMESLPDDWRQFAVSERPQTDPEKSFQKFRDYWIAKPGKDGRKVDWFATWRNWIRREEDYSLRGSGSASNASYKPPKLKEFPHEQR